MRNRIGNVINEVESKIDITPMLDVVFIMLIFFIVTATFVNETGLDFNKPDQDSNYPPDLIDQNILISIYDNNAIYVKGRKTDFRTVSANIKRLRSENMNAAVVIQASKASKNNTMVQVIDSVHAAGVTNPIITNPTE